MDAYKLILKNIKICVLVFGILIGCGMYKCFFTDFNFVENFSQIVRIKSYIEYLDFGICFSFVVLSEAKRYAVITIISFTKLRKYALLLAFFIFGVITIVQIEAYKPFDDVLMLTIILLNIIERTAQLTYFNYLDKYITKLKKMNDYNKKNFYVFIMMLIGINILIITGVSGIIAFFLKIFLF